MTRVLVTGASGFVGRPLVTALAEQGYAVRAVVRRDDRFSDGVETVIVPDLADSSSYAALLDGVDIVIHLAGIAHIGPSIPAHEYDRVNRWATAALAKAAVAARVSRFVFMSSIRAQCGPSAAHVLTEDDLPQPSDAYGRSKLAAEAAVRASGVAFTILRPVLIYGPGVKGNLVSLAKLAASSLPLPFGALDGRRSLLALGNLVSAIVFSITSPAARGETYVVADDALTLPQIIIGLRQAAGRRSGLIAVPPRFIAWVCKLMGRGDLWQRLGGSLEVDAAKLRAAGWRPDAGHNIADIIQTASARKSGSASRSTR